MAAKVPAFKQERHNRFSYVMISLVILMLVVAIRVSEVSLQRKYDEYAAKENELTAAIEKENKRTEELHEFARYTKTKKYAEEVAQEKLGLVHDGEIVFKPDTETGE